MAEIHGSDAPLAHIPDDLTISQFILDTQHPLRPVPNPEQPWFIDETTGREIKLKEVSYSRTAEVEMLMVLVLAARSDLGPGECDEGSVEHR